MISFIYFVHNIHPSSVTWLNVHLHVFYIQACHLLEQNPATFLMLTRGYLIFEKSRKQKKKKKLKRQISYQVCTSSCVSVLITDADKLQHTQEMNLLPALQQKCKSCQVVSVLLWRVYWFLHYLHTENRVLSFCSDQKGVMFEVCGGLVFKMRTRCFSEMDDSPKYFSSIKSLLNMWN